MELFFSVRDSGFCLYNQSSFFLSFFFFLCLDVRRVTAMTISPPSLPRPALTRSHPSDSTLTDPSNPPSVIIDVDYRHPSSHHQTVINTKAKEFSSPPKDASFYRACTLSYQSFRYQVSPSLTWSDSLITAPAAFFFFFSIANSLPSSLAPL